MLRVLGAVRLSRLTEESTSPARQRERVDWWTSGQDARVVGIAEDLDVSGAVDPFERDSLGRWLSDNPPEPWDVLVAWKLDRISRSSMDTERLLRWCLDRDKRIVCVDDGIDTSTQMGQVWVKLASIFAEVERNAIKERTAKGKAALRKTGRWGGETIHYGFKAERRQDGWYLVQDETAVGIIRQIVAKVLDGDSIASIADWLTETGVPTPRDRQREIKGEPTQGKKWNSQTLFKMLGSKTLLGYTTYNGEVDTEVLKAPPILATEEFRTLQHSLESRRHSKTNNRTSNASPLLGVALCLECEKPFHHRAQNVNGKRYRYYYCAEKHGQAIKAETLEELLEEEFLDQVGAVEIHEEVYVPGSDSSAELESAVFALEELTDAMSRAASKTARQRLSERIARLDARIAELEAEPSEPARVELRPTGRTYAQEWADRDQDERRKLLQRSGIRLKARQTGKGRAAGEGGLFEYDLYVPYEVWERLGIKSDLTPEQRAAQRSEEQVAYRASLGIE